MTLRGIYIPITTPFGRDGQFAPEHLRNNLERYSACELAGYVVLGSTGEAILLEREEKLAVLGAAAKAAQAQKRTLIAGTAEESLEATLAMTRRAADLGYAVALVRTPHYYKGGMNAPALADFYLRLAEASPIPVLIYNFPQLTGIDIAVETVAEIARHPNIAGIKESSGNLEKIIRLLEIPGASPGIDFTVLPGNAATLWPALAVGAQATILALADIVPEVCARLWQAGQKREWDRGRLLQRQILPLALASAQGGIPAIKAAMDLAGFYGGPPRLPLQPISATARAQLASALTAANQSLSAPQQPPVSQPTAPERAGAHA